MRFITRGQFVFLFAFHAVVLGVFTLTWPAATHFTAFLSGVAVAMTLWAIDDWRQSKR